jgi:hypothetical protein
MSCTPFREQAKKDALLCNEQFSKLLCDVTNGIQFEYDNLYAIMDEATYDRLTQ